MPKSHLPDRTGHVHEVPDDSVLSALRERRESEQLITDWESETRRLGHALAVMTLDISAMAGPRWAYRFIVSATPLVEDWSLLFYGDRFASLMELPERPNHPVAMITQLPRRYISVLTNGCIATTFSATAVRMHGAVGRDDGGQEFYRAAFVRLNVDANRRQHFVLGAFNCRLAEQPWSQQHKTGGRIKPVPELAGSIRNSVGEASSGRKDGRRNARGPRRRA